MSECGALQFAAAALQSGTAEANEGEYQGNVAKDNERFCSLRWGGYPSRCVEGNTLLEGEGRLDRKRAERLLFEIWVGKSATMKGKSRIRTDAIEPKFRDEIHLYE
jgi:hypothetical protein